MGFLRKIAAAAVAGVLCFLRLLNRIRNDLRNIYSATVSFYRGLLQSIRTCCAASF